MALPDFEALAQAGIAHLRAYDPGHDIVALRRRHGNRLAELGSNESPYGPSPLARSALIESLDTVSRYPDPLGTGLKQALATNLGLAPAQILLGNGSHELLMMVAQVFAGPGVEVVASQFGFAVYAIAAQASGARLLQADALPSGHPMARGHDLVALRACMGPATRLVYLANPNNPTGTWFSRGELQVFLEATPAQAIVVVDEAYIEFADEDGPETAVPLLARFPNLVVMRTFSKAHGLAGLRAGYACAHPALLAVLDRVRESFNVNGPALAACEASAGDTAHVERVRDANRSERGWLAGQLRERGIAVSPSQTNFLLVDLGREAVAVESALVEEGIVLRPMVGYGLPTCLRITVGLREDNMRLLAGLDRRLA